MELNQCPTYEQLAEYASGTIDLTMLDSVSTHISSCRVCGDQLDLLSSIHGNYRIRSDFVPCVEPEYIAAVTKILRFPVEYPHKPLVLGQQLNDYQLLEVLGEGGMGTVYKARHTRLDKIVALKVVRRNANLGSTVWQRFEREMQAVGRLSHPNIIQATDAGDADGTLYLVMEFVEGLNLSQYVRRNGPLKSEQAFAIIRQAAQGLQHAHDAGLIHRDIKPSNIMLTTNGQIKVLDLGLAAITEYAETNGSQQDGASSSNEELTSANHLLGTKEFMAPEQRQDPRMVTVRSDVYALGATLWFLLTGHPPREGTPPAAVPNDVWKQLLADDPSDRAARASDIVSLLPVRKRSRIHISLAAAAFLILIAAAFYLTQIRPVSDQDSDSGASTIRPSTGTLAMSADSARRFQAEWAAHLGIPTVSNGANGHRFALIGPGVVPLGTACQATISQPYELCTTETTFQQFEAFVKATGYKTTAETDDRGGNYFDPAAPSGQKFKTGPAFTWRTPGHGATDAHHPVTTVSYNDALAYCNWLTLTTNRTHRLPTEAEWLWAYRAGDPGDPSVHWEQLLKKPVAAPCWIRITISGPLRPQPVGTSNKNPWELHDMIGNVYEFCADEFADYPTESKTDYCCRSSQHQFAVIQGHCYYSVVPSLIHSRGREDSSREGVGFRVLRVVDPH